MSSDADAAATVALFDSLQVDSYCAVAASVLFIYDNFVTFDREVACFWTAKQTGASLLFFANRWIAMIYYIMVLVQFAYFPSDKSCSLFSIVTYAVGILQFVPGATFSALRAYVLSRSMVLGLLVAALSLVQIGANLVHYGFQFSGENLPPFGCLDSDDISATLDTSLVIVSRVPLIIADILLIYITWTKLRNWGALKDVRQSKRLSLSDVLFRGGTIYFVCLFILNVLHLTFSLTALAGTSSSPGASDVTEFTAPITTILISRFLLELQEGNQMVVMLDPEDPRNSSRNPYDSSSSFISSLGGFVNPALSTRSDDEEFELHVCSLSEVPGEQEVVESPPATASSLPA